MILWPNAVTPRARDPCGDRADCQIYGAAAPYRYALEVPKGQLASLGIGPGSILQLTGKCP